MNARTIGYWVTTALLALPAIAGGLMDAMSLPEAVEGLTKLGYPAFLATLLGVWKLLGITTILAPGLPRLKEWAYAGFLFNLTGAAYSHAMAGDPTANVVIPLVILGFAFASWALRPASRRLGAVLPADRAAA